MYFFFFNDTATTEIYTLSLHDALPIWFFVNSEASPDGHNWATAAFSTDYVDKGFRWEYSDRGRDRKSTRLNSSHLVISYAVFCLKKKKQQSNVSCFVLTHASYSHSCST